MLLSLHKRYIFSRHRNVIQTHTHIHNPAFTYCIYCKVNGRPRHEAKRRRDFHGRHGGLRHKTKPSLQQKRSHHVTPETVGPVQVQIDPNLFTLPLVLHKYRRHTKIQCEGCHKIRPSPRSLHSRCGALRYWQEQVLDTLFRRRGGRAAFVVRAVYVRSRFHLGQFFILCDFFWNSWPERNSAGMYVCM